MFHPQKVVQTTKRTPWQVVRWALFLIICVVVLLVAPACLQEPGRCVSLGSLLLVVLGELAGFIVVVVQTLFQIAAWLWAVLKDFLS